MRELRHENIATFLGFFVAPGVSALVLEHCARGSLEDLLRNEALRLDWTFKASLLLDMIRVRTLLKPGAVEAMGREGRQEMLRFPRPGLFPLCLTEKNLTVWQRVRGRQEGFLGSVGILREAGVLSFTTGLRDPHYSTPGCVVSVPSAFPSWLPQVPKLCGGWTLCAEGH